MHPAVYDGITMPGPQKALFRLWLNTTSLSFNNKCFSAAIPSYAFTDGLPTVLISTMTPSAGAGLIERAYPLILWSNLKAALQISMVHPFFNLTGIILPYPTPWMRWPISIARVLRNTTPKYRWFAFPYLRFNLIFPLTMFGRLIIKSMSDRCGTLNLVQCLTLSLVQSDLLNLVHCLTLILVQSKTLNEALLSQTQQALLSLWPGLPELLIWGFSLQGRKSGGFCFQIRRSCGNESCLFLHPLPKKLKSFWPWL